MGCSFGKTTNKEDEGNGHNRNDDATMEQQEGDGKKNTSFMGRSMRLSSRRSMSGSVYGMFFTSTRGQAKERELFSDIDCKEC